MKPKVSILIATHNYGAYIRECLYSILLQGYGDYEIVVYDDASTDDTEYICGIEKGVFEAVGTPFTYIKGEKQVGQSKAKNAALDASKGQYIFFLDADNKFMYSDSLQQFVDRMDSDKKIGFVYSDRKFFGTRDQYYRTGDVQPNIWVFNYIDGNMLSRRVAFGRYDEKLVKLTDWDRILHMLSKGWSWSYAPTPLIAYRFHETNTGTVHASRTEEMATYIRCKYAEVKR